MRYVRPLLLGLLALAALLFLLAAPVTGNDLRPQPATAQTGREVTNVTLSGPRVVVVRDLSQAAAAHNQERRIAIPRLGPDA